MNSLGFFICKEITGKIHGDKQIDIKQVKLNRR